VPGFRHTAKRREHALPSCAREVPVSRTAVGATPDIEELAELQFAVPGNKIPLTIKKEEPVGRQTSLLRRV
jgi:hypothetical protein